MEAFFLVGPTAVGKTDIAHRLARQEGLDILSADAMLVYKGMDIGTAKPDAEERKGLFYGGLDLATPDESFSVGAFLQHARTFLAAQRTRKRPLLVVGGTGLYVKALVQGLDAMPEIPAEVRDEIEQLYKREGLTGLQQMCATQDPVAFEAVKDKANPRRLMRVLELARMGFEPEHRWKKHSAGMIVGLSSPREPLNQRISQRIVDMYAAGLLDEVRALRAIYPQWSDTARGAIGYREALGVIEDGDNEAVAQANTDRRTRQLARRQMTWFRHQLSVNWVEAGGPDDADRVATQVLNHWREHGPCTLVV